MTIISVFTLPFWAVFASLMTTAGGLPFNMIHDCSMAQSDPAEWWRLSPKKERGLGTWNKIKNLDSLYSLRSARWAKAATGLLMLVLTQWHNFRISGHSCRVLWFFSLIGMLVVKAQVKSHRSLSFLFFSFLNREGQYVGFAYARLRLHEFIFKDIDHTKAAEIATVLRRNASLTVTWPVLSTGGRWQDDWHSNFSSDVQICLQKLDSVIIILDLHLYIY